VAVDIPVALRIACGIAFASSQSGPLLDRTPKGIVHASNQRWSLGS
jgi:hypothetical protein